MDKWFEVRPGVFTSRIGKRTFTKFICPDCQRTNFPECPMLTDEVWNPASPEGGVFCLDCVEKRLGRELQASGIAGRGFSTLTYRILLERIANVHKQHATH